MDNLGKARLDARRALILREDAEVAEVLRESPNLADRQLAAAVLFRTKIRQAVDALGDLVEAQQYQSQGDLNLLLQLAPVAENDLPVVKSLKAMGLQALQAGRLEEAMRYLETAQNKAGILSVRYDKRARLATNYLYDKDIDEAFTQVGRSVAAPCLRQQAGVRPRCAFVVSAIVEENSGTVYTREFVRRLISEGFEVTAICTSHAKAPRGSAGDAFRAMGVEITDLTQGTLLGRVQEGLDALSSVNADVVVYLTFPMDAVAKVMSCHKAARSQLYINTSFEPYCGVFDYVLFINENEFRSSQEPSRARYIGNGAAISEDVDLAQPLARSAVGIPASGVLFGTVGRLAKCCGEYLDATIALLQALPDARLALAGPSYEREQELLESSYASGGVRDRVHFLGRRQGDVANLLKMLDVYLDTYPWSGGQSLFEAMRSGKPVVAMHEYAIPGYNPAIHLSAADERLGPVVELAKAGDTADYVRLARAYAEDPERRRLDGLRLVERSRQAYDYGRSLTAGIDWIRKAAAK